jgi:hypothetical protein
MKTTRREFLSMSGSLLLAPSVPVWAEEPQQIAEHALVNPEIPWREPGQVKDLAYLKTAQLRYGADDRAIVGHNRTCFNNRPLYCEPQTDCVVLAGDRPFLRLLAEPYVLGGFSAAIRRGDAGRWFHEYAEVETRYRCGSMEWQIRDSALGDAQVVLTVVPLHGSGGFALRFRGQGLLSTDRLVWAFGGASHEVNVRTKWDPVMRGNPKLYRTGDPRKEEASLGLDPARCRGNRATVIGEEFRLLASDGAVRMASGKCDREAKVHLADGSAWADPAKLLQSTADQLPMICGVVDLKNGADELFWVVETAAENAHPIWATSTLPALFDEGAAYLKTIERIQVETPDPRLDAAVASVCHPIDAACDRNPFVFRHGCMAFFIQFLGWRVMCGATALGWHERISGEAAHYAAIQVKDSHGHEQSQPDPSRRYSLEGHDSRFWGRGRIAPNDRHVYNTQSQFIDQVIRDWRSTGDPEIEKTLRPMLELHLEWLRECFDPDDDGLYESYINSLPTDSVWYNGGGSVEESAYAYFGHLAAADMARRAEDAEAATLHLSRAQKIRRALNDGLWLEERGHFGLYVEQGGHRRVHADAWVYSQFLPIDSGMTTAEQALQALYYTEWGLERTRLPFGGEVCQSSNWVPWKWSVRDTFGGDLCALALAYFQTGLPDDGWKLLLGATLESAYGGAVPGGLSHIGAGTDFSDNCHMFARTVVEGLFGYEPDYPNHRVKIRPAFPASWQKAAIKTPDYSLDFNQAGDIDRYRFTLTRQADLECILPVRAEGIVRVTLNRREVKWDASAGFGSTLLRLQVSQASVVELAIQLSVRVAPTPLSNVEGMAAQEMILTARPGRLVRWRDLHHTLEGTRVDGQAIHGRLARSPGFHIVLADVVVGNLPQQQIFKVRVTDPETETSVAARRPHAAPAGAKWKVLDLASHYNGDVRTIFQQQYLSPRPKTCSVRLAVDGYSAWTFSFWGEQPPLIDLDGLQKLIDSNGRLVTPQNIPFHPFAESRNIAFTSLWDNWPNSVTVSVAQEAEAVWLLVCGSTFPMQTRIANAELRFRYSDGTVEKLELIPPLNFWSLCPWGGRDYDYETDGFCLPKEKPLTVGLGRNCRGIILSWKLRTGVELTDVTLEALSQDVVIGLVGLSQMNPRQ